LLSVQAAVVTAIAAFRKKNPGVTPITAKRSADFANLVSKLAQTTLYLSSNT
jgi:hypothetical protein